MMVLTFICCYSSSYRIHIRKYSSNSKDIIIDEFFKKLDEKLKSISSLSDKSNVSQYQDEVIKLLHERKPRNGSSLTDDELVELQHKIEDLTMKFDDTCIYHTIPNLIKRLIRKDKPTAKDYLKSHLQSQDDIELLYYFDQYTIEAIILNVLSMVFHSLKVDSAVRVATLLEQLDSTVRVQAALLKSRKPSKPSNEDRLKEEVSEVKSDKKKGNRRSKLKIYAIGAHLVDFLVERELISLSDQKNMNDYINKKKGKFYLPLNVYVICNFDLSILPIKLNLPMVCPPSPWTVYDSEKNPSTLSDLHGGYLSQPTGDIYHRYRLLTSHNYTIYYINIGPQYDILLKVMNLLQLEPFMINREVLSFILNNRDRLVELGLLMPSFLASLNHKEASDILRKSYDEDDSIRNVSTFPSLFQTLLKRIQRARTESFILTLASAYDGYKFYLPAFLDFRGRIYRSGILHFHERDIARSLIVFANNNYKSSSYNCRTVLISAAPFHYKSFVSITDSIQWYIDNKSVFNTSDDSLIQFAQKAKNPFQFIANVLAIEGDETDPATFPVTKDASASAYQIMSYLLLDVDLAMRTNLIQSPNENKIRDIYSEILEELKPFLHDNLDHTISTGICSRINRKLVKAIFMPLIYGKTVISIARDIQDALSSFLTYKESYQVASLCMKFWKQRYPNIVNLIKLISHIGWFSSSLNRPVYYSVPMFTTVQDYMCLKPANIWIFDRINKKRRKVTLRIPTQIRDLRKSEVSTFVNFIHQKDAFIAMNVVIQAAINFDTRLYTVHDNFITTPTFSNELPKIYSDVFRDLHSPLELINKLIDVNLIKPILSNYMDINDEETIIYVDTKEWLSKIKANCYHSVKNPIPLDHLKELLERLIPKSISKREKDKWEKRILVILTAYDNNVHAVCGPVNSINDSGAAHADKWKEFKSKLRNSYYCLNY